jgi:hypothetical protein
MYLNPDRSVHFVFYARSTQVNKWCPSREMDGAQPVRHLDQSRVLYLELTSSLRIVVAWMMVRSVPTHGFVNLTKILDTEQGLLLVRHIQESSSHSKRSQMLSSVIRRLASL